MTIAMQIILFFALIAEGALTRLAFSGTEKLKKRVDRKPFSVFADVMTAFIGAGAMFLTCFLLAGSVRVFYAVFFLGGLTFMHFLLPNKKDGKPATAETDA